jgi:hypothetical protein
MMRSVKGYVIVILWLLMASCKQDEPLPKTDSNYFPLKVGSQWIYKVEETTISIASCNDVGTSISNYEARMVVTDSFPNTDKSITYTLQHSVKLTTNWIPSETWTATVVDNKVIVNEGNIKYVKLAFPISDGLIWNGNLYNNRVELNGLNEDEYKMTLAGKPYTNPTGMSFDKSITVVQNDQQSNLLYRDSRLEVYAFNVGLVYKESYLLTYFSDSRLPCYGQNKTQHGRILKQSLKEYTR